MSSTGIPGGDLNEQLNSLGANPLFNMGMGLMQTRYDPNVNPYTSVMQGLGNARQGTMKDKELARAEAQRKAIAQYFAMLQQQQQKPLEPPGEWYGTGETPGFNPYAGGQPSEPRLREDGSMKDYLDQEVWKYQLGL